MNMSCIPAAVLLGALMPIAHGFSLEAAGYEGGALAKEPYAVWVPGYGEVVFETEIGAGLVVDPAYGNGRGFGGSALSFEPDDLVRINFGDPSGNGTGVAAAIPSVQDFEVLGTGSGPRGSVWNAVPEPATAGLGLVGVAALLLGRRR